MTLAEAPSLGLAAALAETASGTGPILSVTLPAPVVDAWSVARAAIERGLETACWSRPSDGLAVVGIGNAWATESAGDGRFREVEEAWEDVAAGLPPECAGSIGGPLLIGGMGFSGVRESADTTWAAFPVASMVLPALTYTMHACTASLAACVPALDGAAAAAALEATWGQLSAASSPPGLPSAPGAPLSGSVSRPDRATWDRLVALMSGAVGRGRLDKVVLARRVDLELRRGVDPVDVFAALTAAAPESAAYLFHRAGRTFLGATPERLVRVTGRSFHTAAVAGSAPRGSDPDEDALLAAALLASDKDREEHEVVVAALRAALGPLAIELHVGEVPRVVTLRDLHHLVTPIEGSLRRRIGPLALASVLHPTPAVGGTPREAALAMIAEHEGFDRGWYAGPVGWVAPGGDGELMVALRGGVMDGTRASLFAGCGIVADSDPGREWAESELKLRPMLHALGVDPASVP